MKFIPIIKSILFLKSLQILYFGFKTWRNSYRHQVEAFWIFFAKSNLEPALDFIKYLKLMLFAMSLNDALVGLVPGLSYTEAKKKKTDTILILSNVPGMLQFAKEGVI